MRARACLRRWLVDGHLALARQVGLGEYWVTVSNYVNLTNNVKMRGGPTDYWVIDPLVVIYGAVGISACSPTPLAPKGPTGEASSIRIEQIGGTSPNVGIR